MRQVSKRVIHILRNTSRCDSHKESPYLCMWPSVDRCQQHTVQLHREKVQVIHRDRCPQSWTGPHVHDAYTWTERLPHSIQWWDDPLRLQLHSLWWQPLLLPTSRWRRLWLWCQTSLLWHNVLLADLLQKVHPKSWCPSLPHYDCSSQTSARDDASQTYW